MTPVTLFASAHTSPCPTVGKGLRKECGEVHPKYELNVFPELKKQRRRPEIPKSTSPKLVYLLVLLHLTEESKD